MSNKKSKKNKKTSGYSKIQELESSLEDESFEHDKSTNESEYSSSINVKKKTLGIVLVVSMIIIISGLWSVYYLTSQNNNESDNQNNSSNSVETEQIEYSISGKTAEEDKKDALSSAQSILEEASNSPEGLSAEERVEALEEGDDSVVSDELKNKMRFKDDFETDPSLQNTTYQALIILSSYLTEEELSPVNEDIWQEVYLDQEIGVAYVPISAFYSPGASFSLEMVYTDGEWKLSPYSLLNIINLSATIQQQQNGNESENIVPSIPND